MTIETAAYLQKSFIYFKKKNLTQKNECAKIEQSIDKEKYPEKIAFRERETVRPPQQNSGE